MKKFYLEKASIKRKKEAIKYIQEFYLYNSKINGDGGLNKMLDDYEGWLITLDQTLDDEKRPKDRCPCEEYFLICEDDDSLVGMINLRWNLNENLLMHGGHIGYSIRPTKRRLGYNKINLYLCLLKAQEKNIKKVLLTAYKDNIGSVKTILALGGKLENEIETEKGILGRYWISVDEEIEKIKKERGDLAEQSNRG